MSTITPPAWAGPTTAPTTSRYNLGWTPYDPKLIQSAWSPEQKTAYSDAEGSAISRLASLIQQGGYSPEQKQMMYGGRMAPVYQQAEESARQTEADAYSRGLGQSGVLSRGYGDIQKQVLASGQQTMGQIEQEGAGMVMPAIQATQQGQQNLLQMQQQQSQFNAELQQSHEQLAAQLNMHGGDLQIAMNQINATLEMSDADRQVQLQQIMNQFNLDAAQMEMLQQEAKKDRWSSFFANIFGGAAEVAGGYLGGPLAAAKSAVAAVV